MENIRSLLDVRRIDRMSNARIKKLRGAAKGVNERNGVIILRWFINTE